MLSQTRFMLDTFVTLYLYPEDEQLFAPGFELVQALEKKLSAHLEAWKQSNWAYITGIYRAAALI